MIEQPRYKRASATAQDLAARFQTNEPTEIQEDTRVCLTPRSALRHRPIANRYIIPMSDGTELHVTEWELSTMGQAYKDAAQLVTSHIQGTAPLHLTAPSHHHTGHSRPHKATSVPDVLSAPAGRTHPTEPDALLAQQHRRFPRFHPLVWVGLALVAVGVGYILLNLFARWWQVTQGDWQYGRPRTYQIDANVGHGTAQHPNSHFIALNLNKHIVVIEIAGDDPSKSHIYVGPTLIGQGEEFTSITLSFEDANHDGRPDVVLHVGDAKVLFLNQSDGTFKAAPNQ